MCAEYRIPHSQFLAWCDSDRDKAIWQHIRVRQTCPNCSTRRAEWDPNQGGHPAAYIPSLRRCEGCHEIHVATRDVDDPAMRVQLIPNPKVVKRSEAQRRPRDVH